MTHGYQEYQIALSDIFPLGGGGLITIEWHKITCNVAGGNFKVCPALIKMTC